MFLRLFHFIANVTSADSICIQPCPCSEHTFLRNQILHLLYWLKCLVDLCGHVLLPLLFYSLQIPRTGPDQRNWSPVFLKKKNRDFRNLWCLIARILLDLIVFQKFGPMSVLNLSLLHCMFFCWTSTDLSLWFPYRCAACRMVLRRRALLVEGPNQV